MSRRWLASTILFFMTGCAGTSAVHRAASRDPGEALVRGDYGEALRRADVELARHPHDRWLRYDRGTALAGLGRTEEALVELRAAEGALPVGDLHRRSVATYRRALVLEVAGRCDDASKEYSRYASMIGRRDPVTARAALQHVDQCNGPTVEERARESQTADLAATELDADRQRVLSAATASAKALVQGDAAAALARAEEGLAISPADAELLYDKGSALAALGRVAESLRWLRAAEARFALDDTKGRATATWARALTLESVGRCDESALEFAHYVALVGGADPKVGDRARAHVLECRLIGAPPKGD